MTNSMLLKVAKSAHKISMMERNGSYRMSHNYQNRKERGAVKDARVRLFAFSLSFSHATIASICMSELNR